MGQQAEFKGFDDYIEVFRAGTHTDSKGITHSFTVADLDQMAKNTTPSTAPIVIGHPKTDAPAYGWASEFKRDGDSLFAKFDQVNADFVNAVESGSYKKRSISTAKNADGELYIKHVGWLGAAAPAIKGLADVHFAASDDDVVMEFAEFGEAEALREVGWLINTVGNVLRGLREKIIADNGIETADKFIPDWEINGLSNASETIAARLEQNPSNFTDGWDGAELVDLMAGTVQARINESSEASKQANTQTAEFSEREAALQSRITELETKATRQECQAAVDGWMAAGKLTPALAAGAVDFMVGLRTSDMTFEFAEGDATQSLTQSQWLAHFVEKLHPIQLGKEQGGGDALPTVNGDAESLKTAAQEYQAAQNEHGINVSWADAVTHVAQMAKPQP
ncbi:hypothetical protein DTO96_102161 [Ephemeroptericola cinctiostellae]|uniref:Peptidase n=1 Tax=Ephemeroptericola cinctiostellae TaxID=2268024 RepID=A0A345DDG9_9BURK|nr:hypothetical protein [Ephemeroptericola cinctiostellae]AXF86407.1 hypothetical protein DTO96_102161 [Ephemeroptericola cinctiostellae]